MRTIVTGAAVLFVAVASWGAQQPAAKKTTSHPVAATATKAPATAPAVHKTAPAATTATVHKAAPATTTAAVHKPAPTTGTRTVTAPTVHRTTTAAAAKKVPPKPRTTWRNRQASPTSDRFKEIQNALVTKGYLSAEAVTGSWDQASADALKRFQAEQNVEATGKISSLSLIALGLGPKHDSAATRTTDSGGFEPTGRH